MRASCVWSDIGWFTFLRYGPGNIDVFLDGAHIDLAITADEEKGFIVRHVPDENGKPFLDETKSATVKETLYGKVEIKGREAQ